MHLCELCIRNGNYKRERELIAFTQKHIIQLYHSGRLSIQGVEWMGWGRGVSIQGVEWMGGGRGEAGGIPDQTAIEKKKR